MKHTWRFTINQFLVATRNNYKKAYKLSFAHDARLKSRMDNNPGDPDYAFAYNRYHPLHEDLANAYSRWKASGGMQKGDTLSVIQLLKLLPAKVNKFDWMIQEFYEKGSERYTQLFPRGHKTFYRGSYDSRISALKVLSKSIGTEADLAPVKLLIDNFASELELAKEQQTGGKVMKSTGSSYLETARVEAMIGQYQNVGFFINKFPRNPEFMESLFDVPTLTNPDQVIWKGRLDAMEIHPVMIHTFALGDMIRVKSIGPASLMVYLASTPGGTDSKPVIIEANKALKFDVALFEVANLSKHRYLTIINCSETEEVRFMVQLY